MTQEERALKSFFRGSLGALSSLIPHRLPYVEIYLLNAVRCATAFI